MFIYSSISSWKAIKWVKFNSVLIHVLFILNLILINLLTYRNVMYHFLKNMTKMRISWCWKVGCLTKIIYQAENKTNNQNYCLQTIVQCGAEIARLTSQIFMHKKFGLKSINQPEVTNNWHFCSPIIVHLLSFHFKHDILTLTRF